MREAEGKKGRKERKRDDDWSIRLIRRKLEVRRKRKR